MEKTAPAWPKFAEEAPDRYFSSMHVEQHAWATKELIGNAAEFANELEKELFWHPPLILLFIPLADFEASGAYRLRGKWPCLIVYANNASELRYTPRDAFVDFWEECLKTSESLHDYLTQILSYALAHGMDVAKLDEEGNGRSLLYGLPHSELHGDSA